MIFFLPFLAFQTPFVLEVFTDDATSKELASAAGTAASGFEMHYRQIPCGIGK